MSNDKLTNPEAVIAHLMTLIRQSRSFVAAAVDDDGDDDLERLLDAIDDALTGL